MVNNPLSRLPADTGAVTGPYLRPVALAHGVEVHDDDGGAPLVSLPTSAGPRSIPEKT